MPPSPECPEPALPQKRATEMFARAGFRHPTHSAPVWRKVWSQLTSSNPFQRLWPETWRDLQECAAPDLALGRLTRWVEADLESGESPYSPRARRWAESRRFRRGFLLLSGISPALGEYLLSGWERFEPEVWQTGWETHASLLRRLLTEVADSRGKEFLRRLRRFKSTELLRIAYLDCHEDLPVHQVTLQISTLADVLVSRCFEHARLETAHRLRYVAPEGGFSVLALGKLGSRELNYSSDIDLNFIYDETISTLLRRDGKSVENPLEIGEYFTRLAQNLVSSITSFTEEGQLYRLDTRLRPEGSAGRLVWSARASLDYYYGTGRAWERQALIRLRPIAGDVELANRFQEELRSFIFPTTLSDEEITELRTLKLQMERVATDRAPQGSELKIGRGGIRDVEYIVQYLQLIHGAHIPSLRTANVFEALETLEQEGLLKAEETDVLRRGYRFLRRVEHHLQMANMLRTHRLPDDPGELLRLARGLGFENVPVFRGRLSRHKAEIRRVYRLLFEQATELRPTREELPVLLDLPVESVGETGVKVLAAYGFQSPEQAFKRLQALAGKDTVDAGRTQEVFKRLVFKLLRELSRQPEPDQTLSNFEDCVRSLGARSVFYQLLDEAPEVLKLFVDISARSTMVVEIIRRHPHIFDEVVDAMLTGYSFDCDSLKREVDRLLKESADFSSELFSFKYVHLLLTAIQDLEGIAKLRATMQHVAEIAEALFHGLLQRCQEEAEEKFGNWKGQSPKFLALGLGKLGGQEMTYKSDIDVVFLYEGEGVTNLGIAPQEYFERLSQMVLGACKVADSLGPLLHVDVRLRPLGNHNSLAISMNGWRHYFLEGPAQTWERQAFMRARVIGGDPGLAAESLSFIREHMVLRGTAGPPDEEKVKRDVWEMRQKLQAHAREDDLKRGEGGIMDVEFLVQALQLLHGKEHPSVLVPNTGLALGKLQDAERLSPTEASRLFNSYQFLRWIENRFTLVSEPGQSLSTMDESQLEPLLQKIGYRSTGEESTVEIFRGELNYHRRQTRALLRKVLGVEG